MSNPNIIFIVLDTLRDDKVSIDNNNNDLTPYIRKLLNNSIFFQNCISNSPWTLPSHISMFTGLYPSQIKLISHEVDKLTHKIPILTEILKDMGYSTVCFTENAFISKMYGLDRGFVKFHNVWDWNPWIRENYKLSIFIKSLYKIEFFLKKKTNWIFFFKYWQHFRDRCEKVIKYIIKMLFLNHILFKLKNNTIKELDKFSEIFKKNSNKPPFYFFFNFLTTHDPYIPLAETFPSFGITLKDFKMLRDMLIFPLKTRLNVNIKSKRLTDEKTRVINKLYNACVFSADIVIKKVFSILKSLNLLENSYVIITSDHGEHLGNKRDHYFWEHNTYQSVYEPLMKVPLIIYNKNFKKRIIESQVQLKDLFHTILHMTEIPIPQNKYLDLNSSILYQIENNSTPKYIFGEYINKKDEMLELINVHRRSIKKELIPIIFNGVSFLRNNEYKYIRVNNTNLEEFYDLSKNYDEIQNEIDMENENFKNMKSIMNDYLYKVKNFEDLKEFITKKEKDIVKKIISNIKINGI